MRRCGAGLFVFAFFVLAVFPTSVSAQIVTATLVGRVTDPSGGVLPKASVTAVNTATGFSRSTQTSDTGEYLLAALPVGDYTVTVELTGFRKEAKTVTLQIGQVASLDFSLALGRLTEQVEVQATTEVTEPTRTQVSTVITENQIDNLPVNGREFIDFALLSPAVQIGDTTSGSTDVIVEPVTKLSFAGQNNSLQLHRGGRRR
jgi:Carboxypeptidase regulatory-like domain